MNDDDLTNVSKLWWLEESKDQLHKSIFAVVDTIDNNSGWKFDEMLAHRQYYLDRSMSSRDATGIIGDETGGRFGGQSMNGQTQCNAIKMAIDTVTSKLAKEKPRIKFLTNKGNWEQQERAKKLTRFVDAIFDENDVYSKMRMVFRDGCVDGTGCFKIAPSHDGKSIVVERVQADRIKVDEIEAFDGKPEQMHQEHFIPRYKLKFLYPDFEDEIDACGQDDFMDLTIADRIKVIESWKLPSIPGSRDGLHSVCISNCTLATEEYKKDFFPFVFFRWTDPLSGFYGQSAVFDMAKLQDRLNEVTDSITRGTRLMCVPRIWIPVDTKLLDENITNEVGGMYKFSGAQPPSSSVASGSSNEMYSLEDKIFEKIFQVMGVSMLSAVSAKPAGMDSGKALMTYADFESDRFADTTLAYRQLALETAMRIVDLAKDLYSDNKNVKLRDKNKFVSRELWGNVDMKADKYQMSVFSTNFLPRDPAGQLQFATDLVKSKIIDGDDALMMLDYEDTEAAKDKKTSETEVAEMIASGILLHGKWITPEKWMNPAKLQEVARRRYLAAWVDDSIDEKNMDLMRSFLDKLDELNQQQAEAAAPQAAPQQPMPDPNDPNAGMPQDPNAIPQDPNQPAGPMPGDPNAPQQAA